MTRMQSIALAQVEHKITDACGRIEDAANGMLNARCNAAFDLHLDNVARAIRDRDTWRKVRQTMIENFS